MIITKNVITLNDKLEEYPSRDQKIEDLLEKIVHKTKGKVLYYDFHMYDGLHSNFLYFLSDAYSLHRKISITPNDLWYIVLSEISRSVNEVPEAYRELFSNSKDKVEILVHTNSVTELPLDTLLEQLKSLVPVDVNLFIPKFSTDTTESRLAMLASFAGTVKSYYSYGTFCCGIPVIELQGTRGDWDLFCTSLAELKKIFKKYSLSSYIEKVLIRSSMIRDTYLGADNSFFKDIFTKKNVGSGGQLKVNGWFCSDFFINQGDNPLIENFPNTWSVVPYKNLSTDRNFSLVVGCFSHSIVDGFRRTNYNSVIVEHENSQNKSLHSH